MSFKTLKNYINKKMRMSHIYQPVMLMELLKNKGRSSTDSIAKQFLRYDEAQILLTMVRDIWPSPNA